MLTAYVTTPKVPPHPTDDDLVFHVAKNFTNHTKNKFPKLGDEKRVPA